MAYLNHLERIGSSKSASLNGPDYIAANHLLFEVIKDLEPRMKADQAYPPVVGMGVLCHLHGLSNEEAERRLLAGLE